MRSLIVLFAVCLVVFAQDANDCPNYPTCKECIAHNLCGWCSVPVIYSDGSTGPRCAGKPLDPNKPPPGWKPWTCPKDFQNRVCYGYKCDNTTYQCVSAGPAGGGIPLEECVASCFPPTYECNTTTHQCYQVTPGHGTDLPDCERQCQSTTTTSTSSTGNTSGGTSGNHTTGSPAPQQDNYMCDPVSLTCIQSTSGSPKNACLEQCGVPQNVTPVFVIGNYRGLEVDVGYVKGEWQAKITANDIIIVDPTGATWAKGVVRQYNNELWLVTPTGTRRGIFGLQQLPEVTVLTWAMGAFGQPPPSSFDNGLSNGKTFVLAKCINSNDCQWHMFQALAQLKLQQEQWAAKKELAKSQKTLDPVNDPCSVYTNCHDCIKAPQFCGWCSVDVLYNGTIPGKNCAGLNTTITPRFNCSGTFSTQDCLPTTTGVSTGIATGHSTGNPSMYFCDPINATCEMTPNGTLPGDVCKAQCTVNPIPPILQNKYFRGLEIDTSYKPGEWRAHFTTNTVTIVSADGTVIQGNVTTISEYLTITTATGKYQTLWQLQPGPAVDNLSWAWGVLNGLPPTSFDDAMTKAGEKEFWFVSCHDGAPTSVCDFSK